MMDEAPPRPTGTDTTGTGTAGTGTAVGILNRIQAHTPDMSTVTAKIASYLLRYPQAPLRLTIMELADETGASAATITRFCRLIGFHGYSDFRVAVAADFGRNEARETWTTDIGRAFGPDDGADEVLSTLINAHQRSLQATAANLDLPQLKALAATIAASKRIDVYGIAGSGSIASELQQRLFRIGITAYAWQEVHLGLTSAALLDEECVAIAVSNTGRTEETIDMLAAAKAAGATTVALTNSPGSPLAELADHIIVTAAHEQYLRPDDLSAKHAQLLVIDLLYLLVAQQNFERTATYLAATARAVAGHRQMTRNGAKAPASTAVP